MRKVFHYIKSAIVLSVVLLQLEVSAQNAERPYQHLLSNVENKLKAGNLNDALTEMDNITAAYPEAADVHYGKAILLNQVGNKEGAIESAEKAYNVGKEMLYGNFLLDLLKATGQSEKVLEVSAELYANYPSVTATGRNYLMTLADAEKLDEAIGVYNKEKAKGHASDTLDVVMAESYLMNEKIKEAHNLLLPLEGSSKLPQLYSMLAFTYSKEKKDKQATAVLNKGIELTKFANLYLDLADSYKNEGKLRQAFESLKLAFESKDVEFADKYRIMITLMNPNMKDFSLDQVQILANTLVVVHPRIAESHLLKGEVLWNRGELTEARSLFLVAVGINPRHIDGWRMLINTDLSLKQPEEAIKHGLEGLAANPNHPILLYFTGLAYFVQDDLDNGRAYLENALNYGMNENSFVKSMIYSSLGDIYHQLKMESASDVAYEEAILLDSTNVSAMNNLAYYLAVRNKDLDKAAKYAQKANEIDPNSGTFQDTYAWVLFKQGNYKESLKWMEKAMKSSAEPSAVLYEHYGDVLSKVNKTKEAIKNWEKALSLSASSGENVDRSKIEEKIKKRSYVE